MEKQKKSALLLIALVRGVAYVIYSLWYWYGGGALGQVGAESTCRQARALPQCSSCRTSR